MTLSADRFRPGKDAVSFLALGGTGEIGMNMALYGYDGRWLMVDCGIGFADERTPGVDILVPDPEFIEARKADLVGLVLTHAHEDHLGAVQYLWERFRTPVYATPFTASVLRHKLEENNVRGVPIHIVPLGGRFDVGPFNIEMISLTHSIPEPSALVLRTPVGAIVHSGDWKIDPNPIIGRAPDIDALRRVGDEGVLALLADSTNVFQEGHSGSEADVRDSFAKLFGTYPQRIAIACFATNVARLHSIAVAAAANDRHVALVGRSLWRINHAARETGYLTDLPDFLRPDDIGYLPRDKVVLVCTGSQGEPRSALSRISRDDHPDITLDAGDVVIFSSREIPGNEKAIAAVQNGLVQQGVDVITAEDAFVHVSGHPYRDEMASMYQWLRPQIAIPVHGEERHLRAHARLAADCQVPDTLVTHDGALIRISAQGAEMVDVVPTGRLAIDGNRLVKLDGNQMRMRRRVMHNGVVVVTLALDFKGKVVAPPQIAAPGLLDDEEDEDDLLAIARVVEEAVRDMPPRERGEDGVVEEVVRVAVRRWIKRELDKKPVVRLHVLRV
jgi:ribonuclease J